MRKLWIGVAFSGLLAAPAMAADIPARIPVKAPPPAVVAVYNWSGCYIGGHVGGLWGRTRWSSLVPNDVDNTPNQDVDYTEFTGGGHIGCNVQVNRVVFGVEADASWVDVNKYGILDIVNRDEILRTKFSWYGSARGRLGVAFNRSMIYGTGGVAFSRVRNSYENYVDATLSVLQNSVTATRTSGWVAGGGWEYAFSDRWIGRAEYLHFSFRKHSLFPPPANIDAQTSFHVGRIGLSYKFGPRAVVARY